MGGTGLYNEESLPPYFRATSCKESRRPSRRQQWQRLLPDSRSVPSKSHKPRPRPPQIVENTDE